MLLNYLTTHVLVHVLVTYILHTYLLIYPKQTCLAGVSNFQEDHKYYSHSVNASQFNQQNWTSEPAQLIHHLRHVFLQIPFIHCGMWALGSVL